MKAAKIDLGRVRWWHCLHKQECGPLTSPQGAWSSLNATVVQQQRHLAAFSNVPRLGPYIGHIRHQNCECGG
jgi:hypothetical protein